MFSITYFMWRSLNYRLYKMCVKVVRDMTPQFGKGVGALHSHQQSCALNWKL